MSAIRFSTLFLLSSAALIVVIVRFFPFFYLSNVSVVFPSFYMDRVAIEFAKRQLSAGRSASCEDKPFFALRHGFFNAVQIAGNTYTIQEVAEKARTDVVTLFVGDVAHAARNSLIEAVVLYNNRLVDRCHPDIFLR